MRIVRVRVLSNNITSKESQQNISWLVYMFSIRLHLCLSTNAVKLWFCTTKPIIFTLELYFCPLSTGLLIIFSKWRCKPLTFFGYKDLSTSRSWDLRRRLVIQTMQVLSIVGSNTKNFHELALAAAVRRKARKAVCAHDKWYRGFNSPNTALTVKTLFTVCYHRLSNYDATLRGFPNTNL